MAKGFLWAAGNPS